MNNPPYLPAKDQDLLSWAVNFSTLLTAHPTDYGLVSGDAVAVAAATSPFVTAMPLATNPATRSSATIADKDSTKAAMLNVLRPYAVNISLAESVDDSLKVGIGVTARKTTKTRNSVTGISTRTEAAVTTNTTLTVTIAPLVTKNSKQKPVGALGWEVQVQGYDDEADPTWFQVFSAVFTKNLVEVDPSTWDEAAKYRFRTRWVGASLQGGRQNVGPWSAWQPLPVP